MRSAASPRRARALTDVPLYAGFGISTPEQARAAADLTDGVVVGSRAVLVAEEGPAALQEYVGVAAPGAADALRPAPSLFDCTRSPQRSQRWNRSVRKNHRAFGTLWPKSLQRRLTRPARP